MFTGIVSDIGRVMSVERGGDMRLTIGCTYDPGGIAVGASILCAGICLSAVATGTVAGQNYFTVEASAETRGKTTLGSWRVGTRVNLERALRVGDELGGHLVSGHIDGVGEVVEVIPDGASRRLLVRAPKELLPFVAEKGSICFDGVSLTVNEVRGSDIAINLIPHTISVTTFDRIARGQLINIEIDMLARYIARLASFRAS
jgi:riboflavin synthase